MRLDIYILRAVPCSILAQEKGERLVIVTYGNAHMARLEIYGLASRNIWIARSTMQHSGTSEGERLVIGTSGSAHMARLETYVLHALTWNILAEAT